jgi:hypothetical protein
MRRLPMGDRRRPEIVAAKKWTAVRVFDAPLILWGGSHSNAVVR